MVNFTERELREIDFARMYENVFNHGTDGHHKLIVISKLSKRIEELEEELAALKMKVKSDNE